jgi:hypothetical protein
VNNGVPKKEKEARVPQVKRCDHIQAMGKGDYIRCDTLTTRKGKTKDGRTVYCCPSHEYLYK